MANYYDNSDEAQRFQPGTTVRADEVDSKFDEIASGFSEVGGDVGRSLKLVADGSDHEVSASATERRNRVVGFDGNGDMALLRGFSWRGDFAANTEYFVNDVFRDPATKNLLIVEERHTSGSTIDTGKTDLAINVADVELAKDAAKASEDEAEAWASRTSGQVDSIDYSAKAYAIGGSGVDDTIGSAKDWAIKTDATVDGTNYSAKYWATDTNVTTVSSNIGDITTVAADISDVITVSAEIGAGLDVTVVAGDLTGMDTIGTVSASITDVGTVATDITNVNSVASSITDVQTTASNIADIGTVAGNISDVTNFADLYIGASSNEPSERRDGSALQAGDLYFNTTADRLYVYNGSAWQVSTASADQVSFDSSTTSLSANDVQAVIEELQSLKARLDGDNTFTGNQQVTGDLTVDGTIDCGTLV